MYTIIAGLLLTFSKNCSPLSTPLTWNAATRHPLTMKMANKCRRLIYVLLFGCDEWFVLSFHRYWTENGEKAKWRTKRRSQTENCKSKARQMPILRIRLNQMNGFINDKPVGGSFCSNTYTALRLTTNEVAIHWFLYCFKLIVSVKSLLNNWILLTKSLSVSPTRLKFYLYLVDNRTAERCVTIQPNAAVVDHTCRNADSFHHFRCNRCRKTQKLFRSSGKSSHSKIHVCIWAVWHRQNFICTWKSESDIIIGFSDLIETLLARYILV